MVVIRYWVTLSNTIKFSLYSLSSSISQVFLVFDWVGPKLLTLFFSCRSDAGFLSHGPVWAKLQHLHISRGPQRSSEGFMVHNPKSLPFQWVLVLVLVLVLVSGLVSPELAVPGVCWFAQMQFCEPQPLLPCSFHWFSLLLIMDAEIPGGFGMHLLS